MVTTDANEILLRIPARAPYARLVRVGAAALALREGMGFREIDDLRLAIDEAMIVLLEGSADLPPADIHIVFRVADGRLELEALRGTGMKVSESAEHRFVAIVGVLVDECGIDASDGRVRLAKSAADLDD